MKYQVLLGLPYALLNEQRRMRTQLRQLLNYFYPSLRDHPSVCAQRRHFRSSTLRSIYRSALNDGFTLAVDFSELLTGSRLITTAVVDFSSWPVFALTNTLLRCCMCACPLGCSPRCKIYCSRMLVWCVLATNAQIKWTAFALKFTCVRVLASQFVDVISQRR